MGKKKQTIGYHYIMTLLFGICRGPINEIREIMVGGKTALGGNLCSPLPGTINKPDLFGGEKKEGGIQGAYRLQMGAADQVLGGAVTVNLGGGTSIGWIKKGSAISTAKLRDLRTMLPGKVSQLRGIVTFHYNGLVASMNPYPKEWAFRVRRTTRGWSLPGAINDIGWYPAKATIWMADGHIMAMNPAHIIYQLLTDPDWGGAEDIEEIDEPSFIAAANTLCAEGFGLCLKWERKDDVDVYIKTVLDHIGAALFQDRGTGLYVLKLIRGDYNINDLPLFTPDTGLIEIVEDDSEALADAVNEVIATGKNPLDQGNDIQVRVQNIAAIQAVGGRVSSPVSYPGIPEAGLLTRVAQRDLKASALGLKRFKVKLDRKAWRLYPAMPFRIADPKRGLGQIVLRVGDLDDKSSASDGFIQIKAIEDVFSMPATSFVPAVDGEWEGPSRVALPPLEQRLIELNYRDVYIARGVSDADSLEGTDAVIGQLAASANVSNREYELWTAAEPADLDYKADGFFTDYARLVDPIGRYDTAMKLQDRTAGFDNEEVVGQALLIGDEVIGVTDYDSLTEEFTIMRGAADTLPQEHLALARAWTIDDDIVGDGVLYQDGQTAKASVLSKTSEDTLPIDDATIETLPLVARQARPYPPANLKLDTVLVYNSSGIHAEPVFTWAHRDRKLQADHLVDHQEASVGPEPGTTYTFRIYDYATDVLIGTYSGISGTTWTYSSALQGTDGAGNIVRMEIESSRDGLSSYQMYNIVVILSGGYGFGYGLNYGGAV